jgi:hypothetical protein
MSTSTFLSADQILAAKDIKTEVVHVPEWGGDIRMKGLTGRERDEFEASMLETKGGKQKQNTANFRARLLAKCIVDESGAALFHSSQIKLLGEKSAAALQRLFNKANEMSGLSEEDVDSLTEGFTEGPSEDSTSD